MVKVMLVTSLCWWLYDGDWFEMLVAESLCWRLFSLCWWFSQCIKSVINIFNRSPTSQTCHQHIWSPTSVTNIDVTKISILLFIVFYRSGSQQEKRSITGNFHRNNLSFLVAIVLGCLCVLIRRITSLCCLATLVRLFLNDFIFKVFGAEIWTKRNRFQKTQRIIWNRKRYVRHSGQKLTTWRPGLKR